MPRHKNKTSFKKGMIPWNKGLVGFRKGYKHTEEARGKMSLAVKGKPKPWMMGHKINVGRKHTKETRMNMSKAHKGKIFSEEHIKNIRLNIYKRPPQKFHFTNTSIEIKLQSILKENGIE